MTVAQQILDEVSELDERGQLAVLAMVRRLRAVPEVSLTGVDLEDDDSADAWRASMQTRAGVHVAEAMAKFRALGLVDAEGRVIERELPPDMRPESKSSVAT